MIAQTVSPGRIDADGGDWRTTLPVLQGTRVRLREIQVGDAPSLLAMVTPPEVSRFMSPPPSTLQRFERFIAYSRAQQTAGRLACYAVTLEGYDRAIGLFQVRAIDREFKTAEWGFVLGSPFWGTGIFAECAELVLEFAFAKIGVRRMEARVAVKNGRGNRALQKIGAVQEGILPQPLLCGSGYVDQVMYSIVEEEWRAPRVVH